jgi:NADPH2:quinone reductase
MPRAIRIERTGGPDVLELVDFDTPAPGPGEALISQRVIGVNFIDTYHRSGLYPLPLPSGLGVEAAGVVEAVGPDVSNLEVGTRVAYAGGPPGAYAEKRVLPADRLVALPDEIDDEQAAAVLLKGMTVEALIQRVAPVRSGDTVLLHAAAGGVGLLACQWLSSLGVRVIATVGSDAKAALVRKNGAAEVIVTGREDFVERVKALTSGRGVRIVYDGVGQATVPGSLECLEQRGILALFGNASGKPEPIDVGILAKASLSVARPVLFHYIATREELVQSANAVFAALRDGRIHVHIGQRFPLSEAVWAHTALEARSTVGATLLLP